MKESTWPGPFSISCHRLLLCKLWHVPYWVAFSVRACVCAYICACVCACLCTCGFCSWHTNTHTGEQTHTHRHTYIDTRLQLRHANTFHLRWILCRFACLAAIHPPSLTHPTTAGIKREERERVGNIACKLSRFSNTLPQCYPKNIFSFSFLLSTNAAACVLKRKISFSF